MYYIEQETKTAKKYRCELFQWHLNMSEAHVLNHIHPAIEILYYLNGSCKIELNNKTITASKGDMVLIRSNVIHNITNIGDDSADYYVLKVYPTLLFHILSGENEKYATFFLNGNNNDKILFTKEELKNSRIVELWNSEFNDEHIQEGISALKSRAFSAQMIVEILDFCNIDEDTSKPLISDDTLRRIYNTTSYIKEHFSEEISVIDCAKSVNMSYSSFSQYFKSIIGISAKQYITNIRLTHAHNLLITTKLSINEISFSSGYNSTSHFIKEFKKTYGKSPKSFRETIL